MSYKAEQGWIQGAELIPEYNLYWDYMKNNDIVILNAIHNIDYDFNNIRINRNNQ